MNTTALENLYQQACTYLRQDPPDIEAAKPLLQLAADQDHADAAFQLAGIYINVPGHDSDYGIGLLKKAAGQGHLYAAYNLLQLREANGEPFSHLINEFAWLAEQGIMSAKLRLLEFYTNQRDNQAVYWAKQVAEEGHVFGYYVLAQFYQLSGTPDLPLSHQYYQQAAEHGLSVAHWQIAKQYRYGQGTPVDTEKALFHLQKAAEQGILSAQTMYAEMLAAQGNTEAVKWYQTAAGRNDNDARAALAQIYLTGQLTDRNPELAMKYAKEAADNRHSDSLRILGDIYRYGLGTTADPDTAQDYYRRAAEAGSLSAYQKLLSDAALNQKNPEEYQRIKEAALLHQGIEKDYQTAYALQNGYGKAQNFDQARKLYMHAAQFHHIKAATGLGCMYFYGQGIEIDSQKAAYWFEIAARQNDPLAQYLLARMYYYGQGVTVNVDIACYWLQSAIDNGYENPEAFQHLLNQWKRNI